jgi:exopolyphosphatase / guanosine-5'-triphosphate,3'-diphosphate pyrophosphatase
VRRAVIDIGTNTLLLLVVEPGEDGRPVSVVDLCRFGRLGQGLDASGRLAPEAIARSLAILTDFRANLDELGVAVPTVIATQAVREAANAGDFVAPAEAILGARVEVIPGELEAKLAFAAVAVTFPELAGAPYLVVDVGGGSTELIATDGKRVTFAVSLPIGAVRLAERHLRHDPPTSADAASLVADINHHLAPLALPRHVPVVATAGTATTLATIELALPAYDPAAVTGLRLTPQRVRAQLAKLLAMTTAERRAVPGMVVERADVLPAGVAILNGVLARVQAPVMIACDRGIRWGVAVAGTR